MLWESSRASWIASSTAAIFSFSCRDTSVTPADLSFADASSKRFLRRRRSHRPAVGFQNRKSARLRRRRAGRRAVEARIAGVSAGAARDLVGDLPGLRQTRGDRPVRALGKGVMAAAAIDRADRRLEAEAAAEARRPHDRAEHLRADANADRADGDRRGRTAAGAARRAGRGPTDCGSRAAASTRIRSSPSCRRSLRRPRAAPRRSRRRARCGSRRTAANRSPSAMSMVSMMSLIPIGMPSIGESGLPARQRSVERSAAVLAAARLSVTKAPIFGSQASSSAMQRSRNARGESLPLAKSAVAGRNGCIRGFVASGAFMGSLLLLCIASKLAACAALLCFCRYSAIEPASSSRAKRSRGVGHATFPWIASPGRKARGRNDDRGFAIALLIPHSEGRATRGVSKNGPVGAAGPRAVLRDAPSALLRTRRRLAGAYAWMQMT